MNKDILISFINKEETQIGAIILAMCIGVFSAGFGLSISMNRGSQIDTQIMQLSTQEQALVRESIATGSGVQESKNTMEKLMKQRDYINGNINNLELRIRDLLDKKTGVDGL